MVLNFAAVPALDDGEAVSSAIAVLRQWSLGTDDRDVISFFMQNIPQLHLISTLDIVKYWADATAPQLTTIRIVLENIQNRACYQPHNKHHLYRWWKQHNST